MYLLLVLTAPSHRKMDRGMAMTYMAHYKLKCLCIHNSSVSTGTVMINTKALHNYKHHLELEDSATPTATSVSQNWNYDAIHSTELYTVTCQIIRLFEAKKLNDWHFDVLVEFFRPEFLVTVIKQVVQQWVTFITINYYLIIKFNWQVTKLHIQIQ